VEDLAGYHLFYLTNEASFPSQDFDTSISFLPEIYT